MLGISAGLEHHTIEDFKSPTDYIKYLFSGIKGWICRGQIAPYYRQSMYRFNGLMESVFEQDNQDNVYISMNTFYINQRSVDCLKRLNALYVDIDCYKMGLDKATVLDELQNDYFDSAIPCPTFVVDSGRGLYLIWKLRNEDRNALPRWTKVQEYFTGMLKEFGADPACKDSARILRIPFSRNTKSETTVEIIEFHDVTYTISDIQNEYDIGVTRHYEHKDGENKHPYNTATEPMRRYAADLAFKLGVELPDLEDFAATQAWIAEMRLKTLQPKQEVNTVETNSSKNKKLTRILEGYCADIKTLFAMRQGADCKREIALFLYRLFTYDITGDKHLALEQTLAINASLSCPFPESYVIRTTRSAERKIDKGDTYHYKRETIIDILEITDEEMKSLTYLVSDVRRMERKRENSKKAYLDRLAAEGKETKAEAKAKRRAAILVMQKEGMSAKEIMAALEISKATYYREAAEIAAETAIETAREVIAEIARNTAEVAENVLETVLESAEQTTNGAKEILNGAVSKILPAYYESAPKGRRTAPGVSEDAGSGLSGFVPVGGGGGSG